MEKKGPEHAPYFTIAVYVKRPDFDDEITGSGSGFTRKEAEKAAARNCLSKFLKDAKWPKEHIPW